MPKRILKQQLEKTAKVRRKSMLLDDPSQLTQLDDEDGGKKNKEIVKSTKHMQYIKSNRNNEVERLLLHNSKKLLYHIDHCDFPALNVGMWPQETNDDFTNYPSCAISMPRPIFVANKQCEKIDICSKRSMTKDLHKIRMKYTRTSYLNALKSNRALRSSAKDGYYHSSAFDMAERLHLQPDPYFDSSYDYYFTGGNLCFLPHSDNIIHAGGEQLQDIMASQFVEIQDDTDTFSLHTVATNKTNENSEIFEFHPLLTSLNCSRQNCFIARQRNLISFNYLNDNKQLKSVTQFRTKSTPFISFAQSERDINTFIITTMKQHVRLYDLNSSAPALVKLYEISPKTPNISWNTVKPWREHTFLYANEKQFFLIDTRSSPEQWMEEVTSSLDNLMCDHISAVLPSDFNNLFYVATSHKLQCMDIRYLKKFSFSDTDGAICRWSHQLRYAPLMIDKLRLNKTEYIALSSPIAGDLHICQLSRERNAQGICLDPSTPAPKHIYSSTCMPYQPPTLFEAYEHARLGGKCLRPEANLEARIKCCTTGLKFLNSSSNNSKSGIGLLLTSNSIGDIFAYTLSKREKNETEERCNKQTDHIMSEFEKKILKQTQPSLNYTEIKNMKGLRKVFLCKTLSAVKKIDFDAMDNEYDEEEVAGENNETNPAPTRPRRKRKHLGRWQKPLSTLYSYKDALVPDLLSIWDIDIEEEKNIRLGNLRHIKPDPTVKVEDWLKENINSNPPMISIPSHSLSRYNENDLSNIFDSTINMTQTQNTTIDFENAVHSTQIMNNTVNATNVDTSNLEIQIQNETQTIEVEKVKIKKKNKKYVKGF
ncbi:TATA box-binding protein-associated factor RNA polymerase I subunit C-like [Cochliomyia hominivorax]